MLYMFICYIYILHIIYVIFVIYAWLPIESNMSNRMQKRHEWNMTESNRDSSNCSTVRMECYRIESFLTNILFFQTFSDEYSVFFE